MANEIKDIVIHDKLDKERDLYPKTRAAQVVDFVETVDKINSGSTYKLKTARTIITNLNSTTAASFNGTSNVTPGVTGILPAENGGTGTNDLSKVTVGNANKAGFLVPQNNDTFKNNTGTFTFDGSSGISLNDLPKEIKNDDYIGIQFGNGNSKSPERTQLLFDDGKVYIRENDANPLDNTKWSEWKELSDRRNMLESIYPIGAIYATAVDNPTLPFNDIATWQEIAQNKVLQGVSSGAGGSIPAGLPNITGRTWGTDVQSVWNGDGAFYISGYGNWNDEGGKYHDNYPRIMSFDASRSNPIYGRSNTVQPNSYKVHFYKRIK